MGVFGGVSPTLRRWMTFVDGENLTFRTQKLLSMDGVVPSEGSYWSKDRFIWRPGSRGTQVISAGSNQLEFGPVRCYYYTSVTGDEEALNHVRSTLWNLGFAPRVFKKPIQHEKAKGVDISLTKDMLSHAFNNHYEVAILIAGDGDYVPLVEEVKHLGKRVLAIFFSEGAGLSSTLRLAVDDFFDSTNAFVGAWKDPGVPKT
jgi:uncharacterized LabA/DUF88 family protein